uniref:Uncharacterized protein n=1 Tax=Myoviridae sp. ctwwN25 TaxID=2825209 RepID=A0A8S5PPU8_9CAUD|nr:MAG TPA: hypothetical protein [Myoviridae sp. ctwwN25]
MEIIFELNLTSKTPSSAYSNNCRQGGGPA